MASPFRPTCVRTQHASHTAAWNARSNFRISLRKASLNPRTSSTVTSRHEPSLKTASRPSNIPRIGLMRDSDTPNTGSIEAFDVAVTSEPLSCLFIGPVESAEKKDLEALYSQARDAYYSGRPIILDEMFDKVERRLRWFRSELVLKYPRCSLKKFSVYADAEPDQSQIRALESIWAILFMTGSALATLPPMNLLLKLSRDYIEYDYSGLQDFLTHIPHGVTMEFQSLQGAISSLSILCGASLAISAYNSLQGVREGKIVALKGSCPHCSEEVYAFVRIDESSKPRHKCECHVCQHPLVFHANLEPSPLEPERKWAYGRIYSVTRTIDLEPLK